MLILRSVLLNPITFLYSFYHALESVFLNCLIITIKCVKSGQYRITVVDGTLENKILMGYSWLSFPITKELLFNNC